MHGSFSIKSVLPALAPDMSYEGLLVSNGITAGARGKTAAPATV
jgi:hypothetical protein